MSLGVEGLRFRGQGFKGLGFCGFWGCRGFGGCQKLGVLGGTGLLRGLHWRSRHGPFSVWFLVRNGGMDPYSSPYIIPNSNSLHNPFPHSLLRTRQMISPLFCAVCAVSLCSLQRATIEVAEKSDQGYYIALLGGTRSVCMIRVTVGY